MKRSFFVVEIVVVDMSAVLFRKMRGSAIIVT